MDAIEAGYHFAGIVGISPRKFTLNQLWRMANGAVKQRRQECLELASLVWSLGSIDYEAYLHFGQMVEPGTIIDSTDVRRKRRQSKTKTKKNNQ